MAVGIVADAAFAQPDRLADAECLAKYRLVTLARQAGIPCLDWREQTFLGHEQRALTVGVDRPALEHYRLAVIGSHRFDSLASGDACDRLTDACVSLEVRVLRP